jgi:diketogulonate reductase-like aldo/keto reductase
MNILKRRRVLRLLAAGAAGLTAQGRNAAHGQPAPTPLHTRPIWTTGERLPVIGLGTWQTFDVGSHASARAPLAEVLRVFVELGGRVVDSSPMYGRSEEVTGELAASLRVQSKLFVATKVWTTGKAAGIRQMEESMRKLRTTRLDLLQVHNLVDAATHLDTLREWKREGRVRYIGVTHYTAAGQADVARLVASTPIDFIQINYSAGEREAEQRLLPLAQERGVAVIANRPFAGGDLFRRVRSRPLPGWAADIECESWAQVLLKFAVSHPAITCAIPASSKAEHVRENMRAGTGRLPDAALRARIAADVAR